MRNLIIIVTLSLGSFFGLSQEVSFVLKGPRNVEVGQKFQIVYEVNQKGGSNFNAPKSDDFTYVQGPVTQEEKSVTYVNGQYSQVSSISYVYVLTAKKEGEFAVPAATISLNGKNYKSNGGTITVAKGTTYSIPDSDAFLKMTVNKTKVYVGEPITAEIKLYIRVNISDFKQPELPQLNGFWREDLKVENNNRRQEILDGKEYVVFTLSKYLLFPQRPGDLTIEPAEMEVTAQIEVPSRNSRSFFSRREYHTEVKNLKTKAKKIQVLATPNKTSVVGDFKIKSFSTKDSLKTNESFTLTVEVSGKGNLKMIEPFKLNFPSDFEVLDPEVSQHVKVSSAGMSGKKTFSYLIIPRSAGKFTIDPVSIACYNPKNNKQYQLTTNEFNLLVEKGENDASIAGNNYSNRNRKDIEFLDSDIRHIVTTPFEVYSENNYWFKSKSYYLLYLVLVLLFGGAVFLLKRQAVSGRDVVGTKKKKAAKIAKKKLSVASQYIKTEDKSKFYEELLNGIWGYLGDRFTIEKAQLSKQNIKTSLENENVSEETISKVLSLIEKCEMAQYAPVSGGNSLEEEYNQSIEIISNVEQEIK